MRRSRMSVMVVVLATILACHTGIDYPDSGSPRYADSTRAAPPVQRGDTIRVASFNVEFSLEVERATEVLKSARALRDADIVLLQEMTAPAAKFIAGSLGMAYVNYPAIYNRVARRDVG